MDFPHRKILWESKNYIKAFQDAEFWGSIFLTFKYVICVVILVNLTAFLLAWLLTSGVKGENFLRAGFFTPNLIGGIVLDLSGSLFLTAYFQKYLQQFPDLNSPEYSPSKAFWAIVIVATWQQSGYMLLIYIAGFVGVSQDYIEAAEIDGATAGQITRHIRLPLMAQSFVICFFLTLTSAFKVYDLNLSLTDGGPLWNYKDGEAGRFLRKHLLHISSWPGSGRGNHFLPDHTGSSYYSSGFRKT